MSGREETYRRIVVQFADRCLVCEERIEPGDDIAYGEGQVVCRPCAEDDSLLQLKGEWE